MSSSFKSVYELLHALLTWADEGSFLASTVGRIKGTVEDIEKSFESTKKNLKRMESHCDANHIPEEFGFAFTEFNDYDHPNALQNFIEEVKDCNSQDEIKEVIEEANSLDGHQAERKIALILSEFVEFEPTPLHELSGLQQVKEDMEIDE